MEYPPDPVRRKQPQRKAGRSEPGDHRPIARSVSRQRRQSKKKRFILPIIVLCAPLCGCYLPAIGYEVPNRMFVRTEGNLLTDGAVSFAPLLPDWQYIGEFPVCIGRVEGGGKLFASSEEEVLVREEAALAASMNWREQLRSDAELPALSPDSVTAVLWISGTNAELSPEAAAMLCALYLGREDKGVSDVGNAMSILDHHWATVYFTFPFFPGLRFYVGQLYYRKGYLLLECDRQPDVPDTVYIKIDGERPLYEEVLDLIER